MYSYFLVPSTRDIKNSSIAVFLGETTQDCSIVTLKVQLGPPKSEETTSPVFVFSVVFPNHGGWISHWQRKTVFVRVI